MTRSRASRLLIVLALAAGFGTLERHTIAQSLAPAPVLKTGQQATYGDFIRDDGALREGFPWTDPRFIDHGDGTATDTLTGLMWMQDAHLDVDGPVSWTAALQLIVDLNDPGTLPESPGAYQDWRLPNINELESLIDYSGFDHALPAGHPFVNVQPPTAVAAGAEPPIAYWSSTPGLVPGFGPAVAMAKSMQSGSTFARGLSGGITNHVWAVRGGTGGAVQLPRTGWSVSLTPGDDGSVQAGVAWPSPRFQIEPDGLGALGTVVVDRLTGLMWTRNADLNGVANGGGASWDSALALVEGMNAAPGTFGFTDWRLPNARELRSLVDYSQVEPPLPAGHPFLNVALTSFWSSTSALIPAGRAFVLSMDTASDVRPPQPKTSGYGVWAVRTAAPPANTAPSASDQSVSTDQDQVVAIELAASDADGDDLTFQIVTAPLNGSLGGVAPNLTYTPAPGFSGSDRFTFTANDGVADSNIATVSITVNAVIPVNESPSFDEVADQGADEDAGPQQVPITGIVPGPQPAESSQSVAFGVTSDNPGLIPAPSLSQGLVSGPYPASVTLSFTPAPNAHGSAIITVRADDGQPENNLFSRSFTITVTAVNDAPVAADDAFSTDEDVPLSVAAPGVLANDTDLDGDTLMASVVSGPAHGSLTLNADGSFGYTPDANFHGADSFTYAAGDGTTSASATVSITVNPAPVVNQPPIASGGGPYVGTAGHPVLFDGSASSDPEGAALSYRWDFGDGSSETTSAPTIDHQYAAAGTYVVVLVVNDGLVDSTAFSTQAIIGSPGRGGGEANALLSYLSPTQDRVTLPAGTTSVEVTIVYGSTIRPATFRANLNGKPFGGFTPVPGTVQTVTVPLTSRRNTLVLRVEGTNGRGRTVKERDALRFVVARRAASRRR